MKNKDLKKIRITEIFFSIQGESTFTGLPCIFIRTAGCNLHCKWCDTPYSRKKSDGKDYSFEEIYRKIKKYPAKLLEITGGEPLLQKHIRDLIVFLQKKGYKVLLETNGTKSISQLPGVSVIMDIKCPSSGENKKLLKENLLIKKENLQIKFVIGNNKDFKYMLALIDEYKLEKRAELLVSPVFGKMDLKKLSSRILKSGKKIRLNIQQHKIIWGKRKKGV